MPTERWNRDRVDAQSLDGGDEIPQTRFHVVETTGVPPMPFGGKVDYPSWATRQAAQVIHVHLPESHLSGFARALVMANHGRVDQLELQRDSFSHDPRRVYGVHKRLDSLLEQIPFRQFDHGFAPAG
jgi:hypothetical protein